MDRLVRGREGERPAQAAEKPGPGGLRKLWALSHHAGCLQSRHLPQRDCRWRLPAGERTGPAACPRDRMMDRMLARGLLRTPLTPAPRASRPGGLGLQLGAEQGAGAALSREKQEGRKAGAAVLLQEGNLLAATVWESRSARPGSSRPPPSPGPRPALLRPEGKR